MKMDFCCVEGLTCSVWEVSFSSYNLMSSNVVVGSISRVYYACWAIRIVHAAVQLIS